MEMLHLCSRFLLKKWKEVSYFVPQRNLLLLWIFKNADCIWLTNSVKGGEFLFYEDGASAQWTHEWLEGQLQGLAQFAVK